MKIEFTFEIEENNRPIAYMIIAKIIEFLSKQEEISLITSREINKT